MCIVPHPPPIFFLTSASKVFCAGTPRRPGAPPRRVPSRTHRPSSSSPASPRYSAPVHHTAEVLLDVYRAAPTAHLLPCQRLHGAPLPVHHATEVLPLDVYPARHVVHLLPCRCLQGAPRAVHHAIEVLCLDVYLSGPVAYLFLNASPRCSVPVHHTTEVLCLDVYLSRLVAYLFLDGVSKVLCTGTQRYRGGPLDT